MATTENTTASATVLAFPHAVVAAKAERARRVARTREWLMLNASDWQRDFFATAPEWWLNEVGEVREMMAV
jgi:hypothetical protein